jgi:branched-chain amino acid transport system ATP-binding protein
VALLELHDVKVRYGAIGALKGITVEVDEGEIVTLLGANGAGKTTTLRTISGQLRPYEGQIRFDGQRIDGMAAHNVVGLGIGHSPEGRRVFPRMSVLENLQMGAYRFGKARKEDLDRVFTLFPRLLERKTQDGGTLSGGEQQMLAIGRALMSRPRLLLLDEPSMGLSPIMVDKIFEVVRDVSAQGVTVLLVEQNASRALQIADRAYVMESGLVAMSGDARQMLSDPKVRAAYLGE